MPDGSNWDPASVPGATIVSTPYGSAQNNPRSSVLRSDINQKIYRLQSSLDLSINILSGLIFKSSFSNYLNYTTGLDWSSKNAQQDGTLATGQFTNSTTADLLSENTLTYNKTIKEHSVNVLAGYTLQQTTINKDQTTGIGFPNDDIRTLNNATLFDKAGTFSNSNKIGLRSYLARVNYSYKNRYLLSTSIRSDGSSYFASGRKWGTFQSLSLGWIASQEKFFDKIKWIDRLKFRASIGKSGNNRIVDFAFLDLLYQSSYSFGSGNGNLSLGQVGSNSIVANPNITWETTVQNNYGLDLTVLKNKINLSIDVYRSETDRLLLQQSAQAFTGVPYFWNNIGSLRNTGIEIELSTVNFSTKNFKWTTSVNFSKTKNEILELGKEKYLLNQGERTEVYQNKVGSPLVQFYGYKTDGVWLSKQQINDAQDKGLKSQLTSLFFPGGLKVVDVNGDNVIDPKDRVITGSPYPDFTWGMTNTFVYKAFDLTFTFQGVQGGQLINGDPNYIEIKQKNSVYNKNRWISPANPGDGKTPYESNGFNWMLTDYVIEDASYYALRDLVIGYKLPATVTKKIKVNSLRFYLSAQNLYFHSAANYRGLNPEARTTSGNYSSALLAGYQRGGFPLNRTFIFGVDINF
jgi:TonB-linked SusC/RagA family outer membrane protein